jgi:hypothetical protein
MPKVTLKTLRDDVIAAAKAVAIETMSFHDEKLPPEGTSIIVTEKDRKLWKAANRLLSWAPAKKRRKKQRFVFGDPIE